MTFSRFFLIIQLLVCERSFGQRYFLQNRQDVKSDLKDEFSPVKYTVKITETALRIDTLYRFSVPQSEVLKKMKEYGSHYPDSLYKLMVKDGVDSLVRLEARVSGPEKIYMEFFFTNDTYKQCDSINIKYYCKSCSQKHIKAMRDSSDWSLKWKKLSKTTYVSRYQSKSVGDPRKDGYLVGGWRLDIKDGADTASYKSARWYIPLMPKKEWDKLTR